MRISSLYATIHIQFIFVLEFSHVINASNTEKNLSNLRFKVPKYLVHTEAGLKWLCAKYIYFYIDKINTSWWGIDHLFKGYMYKIWVFLKDCGVQSSIPSLEVICGIP